MAQAKTLPQNVKDYLDKSTMLTAFGCINLNVLKSSTGCKIPDKQLKHLINKEIGPEMANGEVEFIEKK